VVAAATAAANPHNSITAKGEDHILALAIYASYVERLIAWRLSARYPMAQTSTALLTVTLLTGLFVVRPSAHAQITFTPPVPPPSTTGPVKDKPYVANKVMHLKRSMADGTITEHDAQIYEARDSAGRLLVEIQMTIASGSSRPAKIFVLDNVTDPKNRTALNWTSLSRTATLMHTSSPELRALAAAGTTGKAPPPPTEIKPEMIGQREIHGLMTTGRRTQKSLPAGTIGNTTDTDTEHEWWTDEDLHFVVLDTSRNPQHGEQTTELVDLKRVEPDPERFHAPAGYTLHEVNRNPSPLKLGEPANPPLDIANAPALTHAEALLKLSSPDKNEKRLGAAVLVREAQASSSLSLKDETAYSLARAGVGIPEAQQLAQQAVDGAEAEVALDPPNAQSHEIFTRETELSRYWDTLGFIYLHQGQDALAAQYLQGAWLLDPRAYYALHLGKLREQAGDNSAAIAIYREALEARGTQGLKDSLRERIEALSGAADVQPLDMPAIPLDSAVPASAGTALFDATYTAASNTPEVVFVSGDSAFKPLAATLAASIGTSTPVSFALPDKGPETIVRRIQFVCKTADRATCQAQFLSAQLASETAQP
jgi:hypothetical protein